MAPTCSNCGATDFVWAQEVKTGVPGSGLSLRARGEVPMGTRICTGCGHADLFLRDLDLIHKPHLWRPGEFVPIRGKPAAPVPSSDPPAPVPAPVPAAAATVPAPQATPQTGDAEPTPPEGSSGESVPATRSKSSRRRSERSGASSGG